MAIAEPTADNTTKYWVTDTQLQLLANAIRKEGGTTALLTYPDGFVSAINSLDHVKTETLNITWPKTFSEIYWTTQNELQNIANAIKNKNSSSETLTFLNEFINNLVLVNEDIPVTNYVHWRGPTQREDPYGSRYTFSFAKDMSVLTVKSGASDLYVPIWDRIYIRVDCSNPYYTIEAHAIKFISSAWSSDTILQTEYQNHYGNMTLVSSNYTSGKEFAIYQWIPYSTWRWPGEEERITSVYDYTTS